MGVNNCDDQAILINTLNYFPKPSAPTENEFSPSAPFLEEVECIICMETKVIFYITTILHPVIVYIYCLLIFTFTN